MVRVLRHPLAYGFPDAWATEWGEDDRGVFASFSVGVVAHCMRWIPPGTFEMGSPETEAGRDDAEGPQHTVHLTRGLWLGETPCTQALWMAVMGDNPSRFKSHDRPVENVSWNDCETFFAKLDGAVPGIGARLPTEAEWEYACRAGTTAATWVGDLDLRGENNAPNLDPIAWYGGNSGYNFDLAPHLGESSSGWPNKQYRHTRAGTRPVKRKQANPFGLHDMLGNVWEWCADWQGAYSAAEVLDPRGPGGGQFRVSRGGSWFRNARFVRAAYRDWSDPRGRGDFLGFRLAQGPIQDPEDQSPEDSVSASPGSDRGGGPTAGERIAGRRRR